MNAKANARLIAQAPALLDALRHAADGIQHLRELGADWSPAQKQAWLNGLELAARAILAKFE